MPPDASEECDPQRSAGHPIRYRYEIVRREKAKPSGKHPFAEVQKEDSDSAVSSECPHSVRGSDVSGSLFADILLVDASSDDDAPRDAPYQECDDEQHGKHVYGCIRRKRHLRCQAMDGCVG